MNASRPIDLIEVLRDEIRALRSQVRENKAAAVRNRETLLDLTGLSGTNGQLGRLRDSVDGELVGESGDLTNFSGGGDNRWTLGRGAGTVTTNNYYGHMEAVRFSDKRRTAEEIAAVYQAGIEP